MSSLSTNTCLFAVSALTHLPLRLRLRPSSTKKGHLRNEEGARSQYRVSSRG